MIFDILGYREWSHKVADELGLHFHQEFENLCPDSIVFAVGWSQVIPEYIYLNQLIYIVHPSPLPKYRGGSPIQHQLLAGEKISAITIFKLVKGKLDSGPIAWQKPYSLDGQMEDILDEVITKTVEGIRYCIDNLENGALLYTEQDELQATSFKRRKPEESEITLEEIITKPAWWLDAKIRGLQDPYPNAFIKAADGKRVYLTRSYIE